MGKKNEKWERKKCDFPYFFTFFLSHFSFFFPIKHTFFLSHLEKWERKMNLGKKKDFFSFFFPIKCEKIMKMGKKMKNGKEKMGKKKNPLS